MCIFGLFLVLTQPQSPKPCSHPFRPSQHNGAIISPFSPLFLLILTISTPSGRSDTLAPTLLLTPLPFRSPRSLPRSLCLMSHVMDSFPVMTARIICLRLFVSFLHAAGLIPMVWTRLRPVHSTNSSSLPPPYHRIRIASTSPPLCRFHSHIAPASTSLHFFFFFLWVREAALPPTAR